VIAPPLSQSTAEARIAPLNGTLARFFRQDQKLFFKFVHSALCENGVVGDSRISNDDDTAIGLFEISS